MQLEPSITIRDLPESPALESLITKKIDKLNQFYDRIMHCDVVVELAQQHKHRGKLFNARISLTVPGEELVVNHPVDEDVYVVIRDAFNAMQRQLKTFVSKQRNHVKVHDLALHGYVVRIFPDEDYGFIRSENDTEYYFHRSNLSNGNFDDLKEGELVQFLESMGTEGPHAVRVTTGKHTPIIE